MKDRFQMVYQKTKMFYSKDTPGEVAREIERYLHTKHRVRLFYGDTESADFERVQGRKPDPGLDWGEENDVVGTIGCSMGPIKIPLLIANSRSTGGGGILDGCIVRMLVDGHEVYRHPNYHSPFDTAKVVESELAPEYSHAVRTYEGQYTGEIARFHSERSARNWLAFMQGKRMSK